MMSIKKERVEMQHVRLSDLLNKDFYNTVIQKLEDVEPVSIVFINKKTNVPLILLHQTKDEIEKNIIHVESTDEHYLDKMITILDKKESN